MTDRALEELAARVEALQGPNRAADWQVHLRDGLDGVGMYGDHPHYTASIDAAMTLVPKDKHFGLGDRDDTKRAWAWVGGMTGMLATDEELGSGATPALALTAACLRALAQQEREHEKG